VRRPKNFTATGVAGSYFYEKPGGDTGAYAGDSFRDGEVLAWIHDTTDDIFLSAEVKGKGVDIEMPAEVAEAFANWIMEMLAYRRSPKGQSEQKHDRREAEKHAGHPIDWGDTKTGH
jgi:hypothetical protein